MTDYFHKAAEALVDAFGNAGMHAIRVHATTLEALDKAEAERDALREAGKALIDRVHDFMAGALRVSGTPEYRAMRLALIQPEPDPLDRMIRDFYLSPEYDPKAERHADVVKAAMGFALARHGLAVKEAPRHD